MWKHLTLIDQRHFYFFFFLFFFILKSALLKHWICFHFLFMHLEGLCGVMKCSIKEILLKSSTNLVQSYRCIIYSFFPLLYISIFRAFIIIYFLLYREKWGNVRILKNKYNFQNFCEKKSINNQRLFFNQIFRKIWKNKLWGFRHLLKFIIVSSFLTLC